jgi:cell wall assembly regulator SMI1
VFLSAVSIGFPGEFIRRPFTLSIRLFLIGLAGACMSGDSGFLSQVSETQRAQAEAQTDLLRLVAALDEIAAFHTTHQTGLALEPPLSEAELEAAIAVFPCRLPDELKTLWRWHNGETTDYFIWYHRFLSVEAAIAQYQALLAAPVPDWMRWPETWIPVFEFEGEWYAVECGPAAVAGTPVIHYFIEDEPKVAYVNLTQYMATMAAVLRAGAVQWNGNWWDDDPAALAAIHAQFNPGVPFPYAVD